MLIFPCSINLFKVNFASQNHESDLLLMELLKIGVFVSMLSMTPMLEASKYIRPSERTAFTSFGRKFGTTFHRE